MFAFGVPVNPCESANFARTAISTDRVNLSRRSLSFDDESNRDAAFASK
jgi:hypothetical protein